MSMQTAIDPRFEMQLCDRMTMAQRRSNLGVQEIADRLEVSRNTVGAWLNGRNHPRPRDLKAFALLVGYPVGWLETGEAPTTPDGDGGGWAPRGSNPRPAD